MKHEEFLKVSRSMFSVFDGEPPSEERERIDRTHYRLLYRAGKEAEIFIANAIDAYNFKRWGGWRKVEGQAYSSFDAYISAPHTVAMKVGENADKSPIFEERSISFTGSTVHLGVQVVYDLMYLFWIPKKELIQIGQKKLIRLIPYLEKNFIHLGIVELKHPSVTVTIRCDPVTGLESRSWEMESYSEYIPLRELDSDAWWLLRDTICFWIERAKVLSDPALGQEIGDERGWSTLFSQPVPFGHLKQFTSVLELLDYLGMSDLKDDEIVVINAKRKKGGVVHNDNPSD